MCSRESPEVYWSEDDYGWEAKQQKSEYQKILFSLHLFYLLFFSRNKSCKIIDGI